MIADSLMLTSASVRVKQHRAGTMEETAARACVQKNYSLVIVYIIPTQKYFYFWFSRLHRDGSGYRNYCRAV